MTIITNIMLNRGGNHSIALLSHGRCPSNHTGNGTQRQRSPSSQPDVYAQPHPSVGCGYFYNQDMCKVTMFVVKAGHLDKPLHDFPVMRMTGRYEDLMRCLGHCRLYHYSGNVRTAVLPYHDLVMLALYLQRDVIQFGDPFFASTRRPRSPMPSKAST